MYNEFMKKNIFIFLIFFMCLNIYCWEFVNLPAKYSWYYTEMSDKNILAHNADTLEKKYNVKVHIYKDLTDTKEDSQILAKKYFDKLIETNNNRQLIIWLSKKRNEAIILISNDLKDEINEKYLQILQDDVLKSLLGRWYIGEDRVLGKVLGGIIYLLAKPNLNKEQINKIKSEIIVVDDFFYQVSIKPFFSDLIDLFEFEPVSFFFYFPFVFHFILVRIIGIRFQKPGFIISNIIWAFFVLFIFYLIIHRIDIFLHEYVQIFYIFIGMNIPLYLFLTILYGDKIEALTYNYLCNITGDFDTKNIFEGKQW